jgi:hypothetical protein
MPHNTPEKRAAYFAAYDAARKEKRAADDRARRIADPGKHAAADKAYREADPEKYNARQRARRLARSATTVEEYRARKRAYRAANPLRCIWNSAKERCYNKGSDHYHLYGGRGITMCAKWRNSYRSFEADMSATYYPGLSLDRIDNNGPYAPENCRWATSKEQGRNRRNNIWIETPHGHMVMSAVAELYGIPYATMKWRRKHGKPLF